MPLWCLASYGYILSEAFGCKKKIKRACNVCTLFFIFKGLRKKTKQEAKEDCFLEKQREQGKGFQTGEEGKQKSGFESTEKYNAIYMLP